MTNEGYIKLYRSLYYKGWYKKSEYVHLWVHLLMKATYAEAEFFQNGSIIKLLPGQFVTGRKVLSIETGIKESTVERILNVFETEQQITQQTNSRNRLITIVSWDKYQKSEQPTDGKRTASEHIQERKEDKEEIKKDLEPDLKKSRAVKVAPIKKRKSNLSSDDNYIKFISWFNEYVGKKLNKTCKYQPVNGKTYRQFNDLIGIYGDDFGNCAAQALSKALKDEWMVKNDYKWLTPEFFTRVDKFERYFNSK